MGNTPIEDMIINLKEMTLEDQLSHFRHLQTEIIEYQKLINHKAEIYNHCLKEIFGMSDAQKFNILELIELINRVK